MIARLRLTGLLACLSLAAGAALAATTTTYDYDALGRLTGVTTSDGKVVTYQYDAAGNRTQVASGTEAGVPSSISVPMSGTTATYTVSWGSATGTVTAYDLYEATNSSFSGQTLAYSGTALGKAITGHAVGTWYYRVRACLGSNCSDYRTGSNPVTVGQAPIETLNPSIQVGATGYLTQITTLANLNGNPGTIYSFSETCSKATVAIQSGSQSVSWTNSNFYLLTCEAPVPEQCSATYTIRNSNTGSLHTGTASITVTARPQTLPPGSACP